MPVCNKCSKTLSQLLHPPDVVEAPQAVVREALHPAREVRHVGPELEVVRALYRRPVGVHAATAGVVGQVMVRRRGLGGRERRRVRGRRAGHAAGGVVVVAVRVLPCEAGSGGGGRCSCRDKQWRANGGAGLMLLGPLGEPRHPEVGHGVLEAAAVDVAVELPGVLLHPRPPVVLDLVVRAPRQLLRDLGPPVRHQNQNVLNWWCFEVKQD
jgi:hypothetical protein